MKRMPYGIYSKELREEAVKLVTESDLSMVEVSRRLEIPNQTLRNWVKAHREGTLSEISKNRKPLTEAEAELARLRKELAEVRMERDLLKKAAAYFAKESQRGTRS
jgi:transposase